MSIGFQESLKIHRVRRAAKAISRKALRCRIRTFLLNLERELERELSKDVPSIGRSLHPLLCGQVDKVEV